MSEIFEVPVSRFVEDPEVLFHTHPNIHPWLRHS
jgi:hypothetical protein